MITETATMARLLFGLIAGAAAMLSAPAANAGPTRGAAYGGVIVEQADVTGPPIADPQDLVSAYYVAFAAGVKSGDFTPLVAFFSPDAGIDSPLVAGGASGASGILRFFQKLPAMSGFTVEASNIVQDDPYMDADWRFRAAPGSMRGYLDGHDSFKIQDGLIVQLSQQVDSDAAAQAFMPPPLGRLPQATAVARTQVKIVNFRYSPQVITVPVGATVTWTNNDSDAHAVTTDDKSIDAGVVEENSSISLRFPIAGQFLYYCTVHPGMRGKVIVGQ